MAPEFASLSAVAERIAADFAHQLADADAVLVPGYLWDDFAAARSVARTAVRIEVERSDDGVVAAVPPLSGDAVYVDAGVVTGRTAAAVATAARSRGASTVGLIVGVLPRDSRHALTGRFDFSAGVVTPLGHRDLRWHIATVT